MSRVYSEKKEEAQGAPFNAAEVAEEVLRVAQGLG
jgi:hypothetical protein